MRRVAAFVVMAVAVTGAIAGAVVLGSNAPGAARTADVGCRDVAADVGLTFRGDYGATYKVQDAFGDVMQRNMGNGAAVGDYDGDGWLDVLLLGQAGHHSRLFRNDHGRFTDVTDRAGLGNVTSNARVAQFVDLTGTGRPDLVIASDWWPTAPGGAVGGPSQVFRNIGDGTFTDVTASSGFEPQGYLVGGMAFADYDGDRRPDIYLSYWTDEAAADPGRSEVKGIFPGTNRLYRNLGGYRFEDVSDRAFVQPYHADSFTAIFADFTGDGRPDIYQANDHRPDRFYRNNGDGTFTDPGYADGLTREGNSMGVATAVGTDGDLQLFITNITDPSGLYGSNIGNTYMTMSQDGGRITWANSARERGVVDTAWGWGAASVDMNLDGAPDIYAVQGMREFVGDRSPHLTAATAVLFLSDGTGSTFARAAGTGCDVAGDQRALVAFDYDRDGAPDLLITQVDGPTVLLRNTIGGRHWLTVVPDGGNDAGINARVTVAAGGKTSTQIVLAGGSYLAGPPREAYVGLGSATTASLVRVAWADGTTSELHDVPADQVVHLPHP